MQIFVRHVAEGCRKLIKIIQYVPGTSKCWVTSSPSRTFFDNRVIAGRGILPVRHYWERCQYHNYQTACACKQFSVHLSNCEGPSSLTGYCALHSECDRWPPVTSGVGLMVQVTELLVFGRYKCYQIFYMLITALKRPDCGLAFCFQSFQSNTSRPVTCIVGPLVRGVGLCSSISDTYKDPFATCARWVQEGPLFSTGTEYSCGNITGKVCI